METTGEMTLCGEDRIGAAISTGGEEEEETRDSEDGVGEGDHAEDTTTWVVRSYLALLLNFCLFIVFKTCIFGCSRLIQLSCLVRHVEKACLSALHDERELQIRKQLRFLPPGCERSSSTPSARALTSSSADSPQA